MWLTSLLVTTSIQVTSMKKTTNDFKLFHFCIISLALSVVLNAHVHVRNTCAHSVAIIGTCPIFVASAEYKIVLIHDFHCWYEAWQHMIVMPCITWDDSPGLSPPFLHTASNQKLEMRRPGSEAISSVSQHVYCSVKCWIGDWYKSLVCHNSIALLEVLHVQLLRRPHKDSDHTGVIAVIHWCLHAETHRAG